MNRIFLLAFLGLNIATFSFAQTQLNHEKKTYVNSEGKIFMNKSLPVYFRVSSSPDPNAPSYLLKSEESAKYSNPMYFDTEGKNTLRSPSAVDTVTKKVVLPERDIIFDVYADGIAPVTILKISSAKKYISPKTTFYGKETKLEVNARDDVSGVAASFISVNLAPYLELSKVNMSLEEERDYDLKYYSVDNVGNAEAPSGVKFSIDITAPKTALSIIGENKGNVLSSKAAIQFTSKDTLSGVSHIFYSINDGNEKMYTSPIPLSVFKDGNTKISYYAVDNVGNREDVKVVSTSTDKPSGSNDNSYSFYIDKEAPVVNFEIVGDNYQGKSLFISDRSQFQIIASDEKSGVDKILFAQNKLSPSGIYTTPFPVQGAGLQSISYAALDNVGNIALAKVQQVYVDKVKPRSVLSFAGNQFYNRDTLFITSNTKLVIASHDNAAGVQKVSYIVDGKPAATYSAPVEIPDEGFHSVEFYAIDNVNNAEEKNRKSFFVDNIAPVINYNFSVKAIGEKSIRGELYTIYPSNTMLYIAATDNASGGESILYKINGKAVPSVIPIKGFLPGNYDIEISAYDVLKNKSTVVVRFSIEN